MKQLSLNYSKGELRLEDVPAPLCRPGGILVAPTYSLISSGTERAKVQQAGMGLLAKAKARPDKVRQVWDHLKLHGLVETCRKVKQRLDTPVPLGYSLAGRVIQVGRGASEFSLGDRVACAGAGYANHAEVVWAPRNLAVRAPDGVSDPDAAFAAVGAIAMQGLRQARAQLGDCVLVIGLGLVGQLAVQLFKAAGCRVFGVDLDEKRLAMASAAGAEAAARADQPDLNRAIVAFTGGHGVDVAYVSASADHGGPLALAADSIRDRGVIVLVGNVPIEASRQTLYEKEADLRLSRSYGPGRYDPDYELAGHAYPIGYVRWCERSNLAEFLRLVSQGLVSPQRLAPQVVPFEEAESAYHHLSGPSPPVAALLRYREITEANQGDTLLHVAQTKPTNGSAGLGVGFVGAGSFATGTLLPLLSRMGRARLRGVCTASGLSAAHVARRFGFEYCASSYQDLLADQTVDVVFIVTRHDLHARLVCEALDAGKHVFVEKPLATTPHDLAVLAARMQRSSRTLMVGFNRRFSPLTSCVRDWFDAVHEPRAVSIRVNAGHLDRQHWANHVSEGGGRLIGEGCHFLDLLQHLVGAAPCEVSAVAIPQRGCKSDPDCWTVTARFPDGSIGTVHYWSNGDSSIEKERIEVFGGGRSAVICDFRSVVLGADGRTRRKKLRRQDKGYRRQLETLMASVCQGVALPIAPTEYLLSTQMAFAAIESWATGRPVPLDVNQIVTPWSQENLRVGA